MYIPEIIIGVVIGAVATVAVIVIAALIYDKKSKEGGSE